MTRLRRIAEALARGHRAGQVIPASSAALDLLLEAGGSPAVPARSALPGTSVDSPDLLGMVERLEVEGLMRALLADWARLGPVTFLEQRVAPALRAVGEAWQSGRLDIAHEHFLSEKLADLLRSLRLPFEERAAGPLVILATLPGETHAVGLQMAALVVACGGCRLLYLGTEVPVAELARLAGDLNARAVALSISSATRGRGSARLVRSLREKLSRRCGLLVGGDGAPHPSPGIDVVPGLGELEAWARRVASGGGPAAQ